jgi:hypothetical protein
VGRFLKPGRATLALFLFLMAILIVGQIQAWAFSDTPPKPPLYDLLRPFPIRPVWMLVLAPLAFFAWPSRVVGVDIMGGPAWVFLVANLTYFYLLSCLIVAAADWARNAWESRGARWRAVSGRWAEHTLGEKVAGLIAALWCEVPPSLADPHIPL